jgi:MFS transporter, ACS family, hexuronate transporter
LLFASTVINYIDRQTLSFLAPYLKLQYHWTNTDYANIVIAFRIAYSIGMTGFGRLMDKIGTRRGLSFTVLAYSMVSMCTSFARGLGSFAFFRFLLGGAESANWPGATKAVSEWFPERERALATALFDSGSSIGGAVAPFIVGAIYFRWGWRPAFVVPGILGFVWLVVWRWLYRAPEEHPRISQAELRQIKEGTARTAESSQPRAGSSWRSLLKLPQTWGVIIARGFPDPVFFFIADWLPIYLVAKGIQLRGSLIALWIPFIATDLGNFVGGAVSGYLIKRGWSVIAARRVVMIFGGIGVLALIPTVLTVNVYAITLLFAFATFAYGTFTTIANVLPADLFPSKSVASVSGLSGTGAGIGTIIAFKLVGHFSDARAAAATHAFDPIMIAAGLLPFVGMLLVVLLIREGAEATS